MDQLHGNQSFQHYSHLWGFMPVTTATAPIAAVVEPNLLKYPVACRSLTSEGNFSIFLVPASLPGA